MIFVDSGAILGRWLPHDAHHRRAVETWAKFDDAVFCTSNHVVDETLTLVARRAGYGFAADRAAGLYASTAVEILYATREDEEEALRFFRKYADQEVSFTDCVSFALMKRYKIQTAFTFDRHFQLAGWKVIP